MLLDRRCSSSLASLLQRMQLLSLQSACPSMLALRQPPTCIFASSVNGLSRPLSSTLSSTSPFSTLPSFRHASFHVCSASSSSPITPASSESPSPSPLDLQLPSTVPPSADGTSALSPLQRLRAKHLLDSLRSSSPESTPGGGSEPSSGHTGGDARRITLETAEATEREEQLPTSQVPSGRAEILKKDDPAATRAALEGFMALGLSDELLGAVRELQLGLPSEIQRLAIPQVLGGKDAVLASHTGSGKTLAYMLPVVQRLREEEFAAGRIVTRLKRPRALVLCPTRELAEQVLRVSKALCHHARFRCSLVSGGSSLQAQQHALAASPVDVLIATPGRLLQLARAGAISYADVRYVVIDEADTMFDAGFGADLRRILAPLRRRASDAAAAAGGSAKGRKAPQAETFQTVLVTATITKAVQGLLNEEFPSIPHLHTSSLHHRVPNATHHFVAVPGNQSKLAALLQVVQPLVSRRQRCMVFCNTLQSCRAVDHFLTEAGTATVNYHGDMPPEMRKENLERFRGAAKDTKGKGKKAGGQQSRATARAAEEVWSEEEVAEEEETNEDGEGEVDEELEEVRESEADWDGPQAEEEERGGEHEDSYADYVWEEEEEEEDKGVVVRGGLKSQRSTQVQGVRDADRSKREGRGVQVGEEAATKKQAVLVCTDLAARGLDLMVDHVINFDFPLNAVDYLHRTGRTARMGAKGIVTSLVGKREQALASLIERGIASGSSLEALKRDPAPVAAAQQQRKSEGKRESSSRSSTGPARRGGAKMPISSRSKGLGSARGSATRTAGKKGTQR